MSKETSVPHESKDKILEYSWIMKQAGLAEITIKHQVTTLKHLVALGADLDNPDSVDAVLATKSLSPSSKLNHAKAYKSFTKAFKIKWEQPRFKYEPRQRFMPSELEIDQLIDACCGSGAVFLQILKDTACRTSEVMKLKWSDIDGEKNTVRIAGEMGSITRSIPVSARTIEMVNTLPKQQNEYLFNQPIASFKRQFNHAKKKLAETLQNQRMRQIHPNSFRHWKAAMLYSKTKDICAVQRLLGQRSLKNTLVYVHLAYSKDSDEKQNIIVKCPRCGSGPDNILRNGVLSNKNGSKKQRYLCSSCKTRFSIDFHDSQTKKKPPGGTV
jgi:integrase